MPRTLLPFEQKEEVEASGRDPVEGDDLYRGLPEAFQVACQENGHLWEYLCLLPLDVVAIPEYCTELKRSHGDLKEHNLIYPVGGNIFIHVYSEPGGGRPHYIPIEPGLTQDLSTVLPMVEEIMSGKTRDIGEAKSDEERAEALVGLVEKICIEGRNGASAASSNVRSAKGKKGKSKGNKDRVQVTAEQLKALKYVVVREKVGMGVIDPMLRDSYIEDISCSGVGHIFVEHKIFKGI